LSQLDVGRAFVGGVGIVIIAIYLDASPGRSAA
jgi:ABC-type proline/glycine betaine transport system permease subunit